MLSPGGDPLTDLAFLGASEALSRFRSKELSPVELMEATVARATDTEPVLNAFTDTYFDEALASAAMAADAYASGSARPLEGLAVAIKDEPAITGQRTTMGSRLYADAIADHTDPLPQRVLDAGGIVHARTAAPEFSMAMVTWSLLHGITRNPWNPVITCGGSSGGSGASLAAGSSTLASGSDIGGSIRIPAAMNGLIGFKPPFGRNQDPWPWNRDPFVASGPLGRSVADVVLFQNVIQGPLAGDIWSLPRLELPDEFPPVEGMRIAVSRDLGFLSPDPVIIDALEATAGRLEKLGVTVAYVELDWTERVREVVMNHLSYQSGVWLRAGIPPGREHEVTPYIAEILAQPAVTAEEWMMGWEYMDHMYREMQVKVFEAGFDALVCPTTTTTSIPADLGHPDTGQISMVDGMLATAMTYPFNALGRLPVMSMPIGADPATGVPIGMQIVGPVERDDVPFRVAAGLEAADGRWFDRYRPGVG